MGWPQKSLMLLQSYYIQLEVYYSLHICQVFHFVFHNIVDTLVMATKTKILLCFAYISVVTCSCVISEPFCCWELNLKIVGKSFIQVSVWHCYYSCGWDSVTVEVVEHPPFQCWSSSQSLNEPQTLWGGSGGSAGVGTLALCQGGGTGVSVLAWLHCSHPAHPCKQKENRA